MQIPEILARLSGISRDDATCIPLHSESMKAYVVMKFNEIPKEENKRNLGPESNRPDGL